MAPRLFGVWKEILRRAGQVRTKTKTRRSVRLCLELLEDRSVPTASFSGTISGFVFIDPSISGIYRSTDAILPGVTVTLNGKETNQSTPVDVTTTTDATGAYTFLNVLPGVYQLNVASISGFHGETVGNVSATATGESTASFSVASQQTVVQNFGFQGGLTATEVSLDQFLTTSTEANFPYPAAGSGQGLANPILVDAPTISNAIAAQSVAVNSSPTQIDLAGHFTDADFTNDEVTFNITNGGTPESLNVTLFTTTAPQTVANFLDYVKAGDYNNAIFTRLVSGFVLQGGGLALNSSGTAITAVPQLPDVPNEFKGTPNSVGTLAMALSSGNDNSGTNQFFFNLVDNSASLDPQNFTVFGQVADSSAQSILTTLAGTPVVNESSSSVASANPSVDLTDLPLTNFTGTSFPSGASTNNYMVINSITVDTQNDFLTYSATSSNPNLVTATVSNEWLSLDYKPDQTGTAAITVTATNKYGASVQQTFDVSVNAVAPVVNSVAITPNSGGATLTAAPNGTDAEGKPITYAYQWLEGGNPINGATTATLTLPANIAAGNTFSVEVTPSDSALTGKMFTSPVVTVATANPTTFDLPTVTSVAIAPDNLTSATSLTASPSGTDPNGQTLTYSYQWMEDSTPITGATSATLTLPSGLTAGKQFTVEVTPSDGTLTGAPFTSAAATVATGSPVTFNLPAVTGVSIAPDATDATTLTATPTGTDPLGKGLTYGYQWLQNGTAISGANSATLTLSSVTSIKAADKFSVEVTPDDGTFAGATFTSNAVQIATSAPITLDPPAIQSATIAPDSTTAATQLTATVASSSPATYTYEWLQNAVMIPGQTSATLLLANLTSINKNDTFQVVVTPSEGPVTGTPVASNIITITGTSPTITTS
jgi:cyclophilin family peptidyl-prolyl cis-trans isomerase